jgi:hypothetical protein
MRINAGLIFSLLIFNISHCFGQNDSALTVKISAGKFSNAVSVTSDGKGFLYVLDSDNSEIIKYSSELKEIKRAGKKGWNNGEFFSPTHIDASNGTNIFVSDKLNSRIQTLDLNLGFISALLTDSENIDDKFKIRKPVCSIPINSLDLLVVDSDNPKVVLFSGTLTPVFYFGSYQSVSGALANPIKTVKDSKNNVYIFDKQKNSVLRYDNFGTFISEFSYEDIISIAEFSNMIYLLTKSGIITYDVNKNAYQKIIRLPADLNTKNLSDITVSASENIYILEKNKIHLLKLN